MNFTKHILSVSTLALMATASHAFAGNTVAATATEPIYNTATVVDVVGTVTSVRWVPPASPLAGLHLTLKSKTGTMEVYLGPADFLKFLKTSFPIGDQIEAIGSKVKFENADIILVREVGDGYAMITLRDLHGAAEWQNWGKEIDPSLLQ